MRVLFYVSEIKDRESDIAQAMAKGVRDVGDEFDTCYTANYEGVDPSVDVACVYALKGKRIFDEYRASGKRALMFDKPLTRASAGLGSPAGFHRVTLDEYMPLSRIVRRMGEPLDPSRWLALNMRIRPRVKTNSDSVVIYCGSSQKYYDYHGLGNEHAYAEKVIAEIKRHTGRPIFYRPKPSFAEATEIPGSVFSRPRGYKDVVAMPSLGPLLYRAHSLVTHGSHAGIDAIVGGVPAIILGPGAAYPVASHSIDCLGKAEELYYPDRQTVLKWLSALCFWQWTHAEMASGEMWRFLRNEMEIPAC